MIFPGADARLELVGKTIKPVRGETHDEPGLALAGVPSGHAAGFAGVFDASGLVISGTGSVDDLKSGLCQEVGDRVSLLVKGKRLYGVGEVLYSENWWLRATTAIPTTSTVGRAS